VRLSRRRRDRDRRFHVKPEGTVPERIASELAQRLAIVEVSAMQLPRYDD